MPDTVENSLFTNTEIQEKEQPQQSKYTPYIAVQVKAGTLSSMITRSLTQPLDVIKIRFQLQSEPLKGKHGMGVPSGKYTSILQAMVSITREEGRCALWKGHGSGQLLSMSSGFSQFWMYETTSGLLKNWEWFAKHNESRNFISGTNAAVLASIISMPFDVIRTRIIARDHGVGPNSFLTVGHDVIRKHGVGKLYSGMMANILNYAPMMGLNFMIYYGLKNFGMKVFQLKDERKIHTWYLLGAGVIAGSASKFVLYPFDLLRKRIQLKNFDEERKSFGSSTACRNIVKCIQSTLETEGIAGLYKGLMLSLLKAGICSALNFVIYDKFKQFFEKYPML